MIRYGCLIASLGGTLAGIIYLADDIQFLEGKDIFITEMSGERMGMLMDLEEFLKEGEGLVNIPTKFADKFASVIRAKGVKNVTKEDLDRIINKFGINTLEHNQFSDLYQIKCADESNKVIKEMTATMKTWTIAIGVMTAVILLATLISLISE